MIPVMQTQFGSPRGNCFAACIASILEVPLRTVPNFCEQENWREATNEWLKPMGLCYLDVTLPGDARDELVRFWQFHVISGDGPRGLRHSVVGFAGEIVHDPHPDGGGVAGDLEYGLLICNEPMRHCSVRGVNPEGAANETVA